MHVVLPYHLIHVRYMKLVVHMQLQACSLQVKCMYNVTIKFSIVHVYACTVLCRCIHLYMNACTSTMHED